MCLGSDVSQVWQDTDHHWLPEHSGTSCSSNTSSCAAFHTEKKSYQESYISDLLELNLDLEASSRNSLGNEDNKRSTQLLLYCLSLCSKAMAAPTWQASSLTPSRDNVIYLWMSPQGPQGSMEGHLVVPRAAAAARTHGTTVEVSYRTR